MSMLAIKVPNDVGHLLEKIEVPGKKEAIDDYHITLFCFDDDMKLDDFIECIDPISEEVANTQTFTIETGKLHSFPDANDEVPIVIEVKSKELRELHKQISYAFDKKGIKYDRQFKIYNPHITLSYTDKEIDDKKIDKIEWKASDVVLYGGNKEDTQIQLSFKFGNNKSQSSLKNKVLIFTILAGTR